MSKQTRREVWFSNEPDQVEATIKRMVLYAYYFSRGLIQEQPENWSADFSSFAKHSAEWVQELNWCIENKFWLLEKVLNSYHKILISEIGTLFWRLWKNREASPQRELFEAGTPRLGFVSLWIEYKFSVEQDLSLMLEDLEASPEKIILDTVNSHELKQAIPEFLNMEALDGALDKLDKSFLKSNHQIYGVNYYRPFLDEGGDWEYESKGAALKWVFKPHRPWPKDKELPTDPYAPWLWLLSWRREMMATADATQIDRMIGFLEFLLPLSWKPNPLYDNLERPIFSLPVRNLFRFMLSELYLSPRRTGGANRRTAKKWVESIAQDHPQGPFDPQLFDPQLPAPALQHCAEMRLKRYLKSWKADSPSWENPNFLQEAPRILPAFHALLHAAAKGQKPEQKEEKESPAAPSREHLTLILTTFHPGFSPYILEGALADKEGPLGKIYFVLIPRLIERFMRAHRITENQINHVADFIASTDPSEDDGLAPAIQTALEEQHDTLTKQTCGQISQLLSSLPKAGQETTVDAWLQAQEADLRAGQEWAKSVDRERPSGLFDLQLPTDVLQHCAEVRLEPYFPNWKTQFSSRKKRKFLQAAPDIFPAFHALLHCANRGQVQKQEHLILFLQTFHPDLSSNPVKATLPAKDSLQGKICFILLPCLIEHFMKTDHIMKNQIEDKTLDPAIRASLEKHRKALTKRTCKNISGLLSCQFKDSEEAIEAWVQAQKTAMQLKEGFQEKICLTLIPGLIKHFKKADQILKDQIESMAEQTPAEHNAVTQTIQATLKRHREALAHLMSTEINRLSFCRLNDGIKDAAIDTWLQTHETEIQQKILSHALNWPGAILHAEEQRLTQILTPEEKDAPSCVRKEAITVLQKGRQEITNLTQQYVSDKHMYSTQYTRQVQTVLKRVEEQGGEHNNSLTVVARVAANLLIVLSFGLLYPLFKKAIHETHASPPRDFSGYFFSLKSRRAATVNRTAQQQQTQLTW